MIDYFTVYDFKIWWVGTYRGIGSYWNEYSKFYVHEAWSKDLQCMFQQSIVVIMDSRQLKGNTNSLTF